MKVICKNAKVTTVYINPRGAITRPMLECRIDCPICHGQGYTDEAVVRVSEVLTVLEDAVKYIVETEDALEGEFGTGRSIDELIGCGEMNELYGRVIKLIDSLKGETK